MMIHPSRTLIAAGVAAAALIGCSTMGSPGTSASSGKTGSFFITSTNPGKGGDLGGLAGADAQCTKLAAAAGLGDKGWRAYLSTQATGGAPAVNARDRIGNGPWVNVKGEPIAKDLAELHGNNNNIKRETALDETGAMLPTIPPDTVNKHDIMTGSKPDGTAMPPDKDATCSNWTSSDQGGAMVGHENRTGTNPDPVANASWNSSHMTPGCSIPALASVGGAGLIYCFATK
jgi:hypothetical protein